jgi:uncharacterized protein (DUF169 family)
MDMKLADRFLGLWEKHFNGAELPLALYYTDREGRAEKVSPPPGHQCVIAVLARVRRGESLCFDVASVGCAGGKRYFGFTQELRPEFPYFLSSGIPGKLEGERYKKTPEMVREIMKTMPSFTAPARFLVFKRWDRLEEGDEPDIVVFFSPPDVLAGLFTLANYDELEPSVFAPFSAGCGSIVQYPFIEGASAHPRAVLGMFDVSARPCVPPGILTFAVPMNKFIRMIENMPESFLITPSWEKVRRRISKQE